MSSDALPKSPKAHAFFGGGHNSSKRLKENVALRNYDPLGLRFAHPDLKGCTNMP